jgi:acetolactate synthase-1/2/3 large subunit
VKALSELPLGPVLLGVPQDILSNMFVSQELIPIYGGSENQIDERAISAVVKAIISSTKTVILVDDYAFRSEPSAEIALADFSNATSASVFQVAYRRGPMLFQQLSADSVPNYVGHYQPTNADHFQMLHSADLLITIEDRNMYPRVIGPLPDCLKIALTSNGRATSKNGYLNRDDILLMGDVASNLARIAERLRESDHEPVRESEKVDGEHVEGCPSAVALVNAIASGLRYAAQPMIVDDSQMMGGLIAKNYDLLPQPMRVFGSHGGFVGSGLPIAVGLAAASPGTSVICTLGDQGFTNGLQALAVAGEQQMPLLILVCNNGSSVSLRKQATHEGAELASDSFLANNAAMSYATIAKGFGVSSSVFVWPDLQEDMEAVQDSGVALTDAVKDAISSGRPYLLELIVPGDLSFWEGIWNVQGLEGLSAIAKQSTAIRKSQFVPHRIAV